MFSVFLVIPFLVEHCGVLLSILIKKNWYKITVPDCGFNQISYHLVCRQVSPKRFISAEHIQLPFLNQMEGEKNDPSIVVNKSNYQSDPEVIKLFMINSIYKHDKYNLWEFESKKSIFPHFSFYEHLKFHAQLSWAWQKLYNLWAWLATRGAIWTACQTQASRLDARGILISQPKHMLCEAKRTISIRLKVMDKKMFMTGNICSNWRIRKYLQIYAKKYLNLFTFCHFLRHPESPHPVMHQVCTCPMMPALYMPPSLTCLCKIYVDLCHSFL